jgi:hypothetical protein
MGSYMDHKSSFMQRDKLLSHFSVTIPKIDVAFVSKKQGAYSKYFMHLAVHELFYQTTSSVKEDQKLFLIKNLEVIDKLTERQKFSRAIMRKDEPGQIIEMRAQNSGNKKTNLRQQQSVDRSEIEEEA